MNAIEANGAGLTALIATAETTPTQIPTLTERPREVATVLTIGSEATSLAYINEGNVREIVHAFPQDEKHYGWVYRNGTEGRPPEDMLSVFAEAS